jgi:hypothetical protein
MAWLGWINLGLLCLLAIHSSSDRWATFGQLRYDSGDRSGVPLGVAGIQGNVNSF